MEGPLGMTECSVHAGNCGIEQSCGVRANWRRINDVVIDALRGVTLAQMLAPPPPRQPARRSASTCTWPTREAGHPPCSNNPVGSPHGHRSHRKPALSATNREIREQLGRKYEAGFVTDIESDIACRPA